MAGLVPARWRHSLEELRDDVQRALNRWLRRKHGSDRDENWALWLRAGGEPRIDIEENDDEVRVAAELPGLNKGDFSVEVLDGQLLLHGEKRHEAEEKHRDYYYAERSYGAFSRAIPLPCEVEADRATARYKNGLLTVILPKSERARPRRIPIAARS